MNKKTRIIYQVAVGSVVLILLVGCVDRKPYSKYEYFGNVQVVNTTESTSYRILDLKKGNKIILKITKGYGRGRYSTAHCSHDTIYLIMSQKPVEHQTYVFSYKDGTLDYDGFGGRSFHMIDTSKPNRAYVHIENIADEIKAKVKAAVYYKYDNKNWPDKSYLFVINETVYFKRNKSD